MKPSLFRTHSDLVANVAGADWLVEDYAERNTLATMFGESGSFKSTIALAFGDNDRPGGERTRNAGGEPRDIGRRAGRRQAARAAHQNRHAAAGRCSAEG